MMPQDNRKLNHYWIYATTALNGTTVFSFGRYGLCQFLLHKPEYYISLDEMIQHLLITSPISKGVLFYTHGYIADTVYFEETIGGLLQTQVFDHIDSNYDLIISLKWSSHLFYPNAIPMALDKGRLLFDHVNNLIEKLREHNKNLTVSFMNHSMGNRIFLAMMDSYLKSRADYNMAQIHLFAADIEHDVFFNQLRDLSNRCNKLVIYFNQYDKTLFMANKLNKYPRLGSNGHQNPHLLPHNISQIDASELLDTEGLVPQLTLHRYFYASPTIRNKFISSLLNKM